MYRDPLAGPISVMPTFPIPTSFSNSLGAEPQVGRGLPESMCTWSPVSTSPLSNLPHSSVLHPYLVLSLHPIVLR